MKTDPRRGKKNPLRDIKYECYLGSEVKEKRKQTRTSGREVAF